MRETITYSILQYKHSLLLREAINVGILFYFPNQERLEFVSGNSYRVKCVYPDFDQSTFNTILRSIETKLKTESSSLFGKENLRFGFKELIHRFLLNEDSTALQFTEPVNTINTFDSIKKAVDKYSELLLPGIIIRKPEIVRHNEAFILKRFIGYIFERDKILSHRITRDKVIQYKDIKLKFDVAWQNGTLNLVKPISFDLKEEHDIQSKSAQYFGYLTYLKEYAKKRNQRFDLLIAKPQDQDLLESYDKALRLLNKSTAPKRIITEKELDSYSEETADYLLKQVEAE
jgi:hypothetical protein